MGGIGRGPMRRGSMMDNVPGQTLSRNGRYTAVLVVPTGIGAAIGGYAGDALPVARLELEGASCGFFFFQIMGRFAALID